MHAYKLDTRECLLPSVYHNHSYSEVSENRFSMALCPDLRLVWIIYEETLTNDAYNQSCSLALLPLALACLLVVFPQSESRRVLARDLVEISWPWLIGSLKPVLDVFLLRYEYRGYCRVWRYVPYKWYRKTLCCVHDQRRRCLVCTCFWSHRCYMDAFLAIWWSLNVYIEDVNNRLVLEFFLSGWVTKEKSWVILCVCLSLED